MSIGILLLSLIAHQALTHTPTLSPTQDKQENIRYEFKFVNCTGNLETFEKAKIKSGVLYTLSYRLIENAADVRIIGREIQAKAIYGQGWQGAWILNSEDKNYLSFLPDDGGTLKFEIETDLWFSGNCH